MEKTNTMETVAEVKPKKFEIDKDLAKKVLIGVGIGTAVVATAFITKTIMSSINEGTIDAVSEVADAAVDTASDAVDAVI